MKKEVSNWLDSAQYNLETAEHMFNAGRHIYTVFMCHLALEKTLKAILTEMLNELPPYTHNLNRLIEMANIELPGEYQVFIDELNLQSVPTRYPEDFKKISKEFNRKIAGDYLRQTKRTMRWLKQNIPQLKSRKS